MTDQTPEPLYRRRTPRVTPLAQRYWLEEKMRQLDGLTPAQSREKRIELGMYVCPTLCDDGCESSCHEVHQIDRKRHHSAEACEVRVKNGRKPYPAEAYPNGCPCFTCDSPSWPTWSERLGKEPKPDRGEDDLIRVRMSLCPTCGNKRCPGAKDHRNRCSGSNELGQKDSLYEEGT